MFNWVYFNSLSWFFIAFYTYAFGCRAFNVACGFSLCLLKLLRTFHLSFVRWAFVDCFVFHMPLCTEAGFAHLRTGAGLVYTLLLSASTLSDWAPILKKVSWLYVQARYKRLLDIIFKIRAAAKQ